MSLAVGDFSKFNGPAPDYSQVGAVILNCTPQNIYFQAQYKKAVAEGKLIGYYSWPLAFGPTGGIDGTQCAIALQGLHPGPVFYDIESGSFTGDPVSLSLAFVQAIQSAGRGGHLYVEGGLVSEYDFTPLVNANAGLWVAQYNSALTVSLGAWAQVGALGWQFTSQPYDQSQFFLDASGWAAISAAPGVKPDGNITEFLMALTDQQQADLYTQIQYISSPQFKADIFTGKSAVETTARGAFHNELLDYPIKRQGVDPSQFGSPNTSLGAVGAYFDASVAGIVANVKANVPQITLTDAQVASLAQTLKAELPAAQIQALAAQLQK